MKHCMITNNPREFEKAIRNFTRDGLKPDDFLILRFHERNAGAIIAEDINHKLFQDYLITYMDDYIKESDDHSF